MSIIQPSKQIQNFTLNEDNSGVDMWHYDRNEKVFLEPFKNILLLLGYFSEAIPETYDDLNDIVYEEDIEKVRILFNESTGLLQGAFRVKAYDDRIAWVGINGQVGNDSQAHGIAYLIDHTSIVDATLKSISFVDRLTGFGNRKKLYHIGSMEIERAKRYKHRLSMMNLNIDNFKYINQSFGHTTGDQIIQSVAKSIEETVRSIDLKVRFYSDQFIVLLMETDRYEAYVIAERLRKAVAVKKHKQVENITISIGISEMKYSDDVEALIQRSESALENAKKSGKNSTKLNNG